MVRVKLEFTGIEEIVASRACDADDDPVSRGCRVTACYSVPDNHIAHDCLLAELYVHEYCLL